MKRMLILTIASLAFAGWASAQTPPASTPSPTPQSVGPNYIDADGDGICDNYQAGGRGGNGAGRKGRGGYGPGDGTGNQGAGPRDGSGYGAGSGTGNCDGSGPKGQGRRGRR